MKRMMKVAAFALATLGLGGVATAQPKPIAKPAPAGVTIESYKVQANCGKEPNLLVALKYSTKFPTEVVISFPSGDHKVSLPAGAGVQQVAVAGKTKLVCQGGTTNFREILTSPVLFDGKSYMPTGFVARSSPTPHPG